MRFGYRVYFTERHRKRVMAWEPDTGKVAVLATADQSGGKSQINTPYGIAVDKDGVVFVADKHRNRICRLHSGRAQEPHVDASHGSESRRLTPLRSPTSLVAESSGALLCTFSGDGRVVRISRTGALQRVLGLPAERGFYLNRFVAVAPAGVAEDLALYSPTALAVRNDGTMAFVERGFQVVRLYHPRKGMSSVTQPPPRGLRETPDECRLDEFYPSYPTSLAFDAEGRLFIADVALRCVVQADIQRGAASVVLRTTMTSGGAAAITFGPDNTLWVLDTAAGAIRGFKEQRSKWVELQATAPAAKHGTNHPFQQGAGIVCGK